MNDFIIIAREFGLPWALVFVLMGTVGALGWHVIHNSISKELHKLIVGESLGDIKKSGKDQMEAIRQLQLVIEKMLTMLELLVPVIQQGWWDRGGHD